ncbi:hypothetical protein RHSIM_RhsimUnG0156800 [Rhododendron simsii]|uniref:Uncharacterized protein n=1 Tax=Rhododendron simsii TaxID=118357 RepID=A0A834FWK4_RHOSS|nr:hypothetical protein RHSIM_RhsimUnG0156800 [Rhododendron simsii]
MAETKRYAIVTGANKGIGFGICRQLASNGIMVVLTARDEKKGTEALEELKGVGLSDLVVFHQLDITNPASIASLADFIKTLFGRLDILVNNAGISGVVMNWDAFNPSGAAFATPSESWNQLNWNELMTQTYEWATECLETNYYGAERMIEAFLPLLKLSNSPRIVNVSSSMGKLKVGFQLGQFIPSERVQGVLNDAETLTEDTIHELLNEFLQDFMENSLESKGWPTFLSAYIVSKAAMNAYTRILAEKYPTFRINCVCPGYVKTDINNNCGIFSVEEGAEHPVRLALLPDDGPTGIFFVLKEVASFVDYTRTEATIPQAHPNFSDMAETKRYAIVTGANKGIGFGICRQLASNEIMVVLTARDEKRGTEALEELKGFGLSDLVVFHQLDITNPASIASLADFIKTLFGRLDILVNNAGISGVVMNWDAFNPSGAAFATPSESWNQLNWNELMTQTYEWATECLETNYYGAERMIEAFLPLLKLSNSPRIVNVSSSMGKLKVGFQLGQFIPSERIQGVLNDAESLTEDTIHKLLNEFLQDFMENSLESKGWPTFLSAYIVSKAAMNAYTRILAKKYPTFRINCVCPGYVQTDINNNRGIFSVEEGAKHPVRLALLPDDGPTGIFFVLKEVASFNIPCEWAKGVLSDAESLTEEKIDEVLNKFLKDFEEGSLETRGWPLFLPAYKVSKAAMNTHTRVVAKDCPTFRINCVCPGFVKTDINNNAGILSVEEGGCKSREASPAS